ncbi:MAG: hypothetical protein EZS28_002293 [Streblomastix strix]|uniref:Uncharacterized protein n=1 Tax=Streblomastix strix TaxID=222440 RepID=A0A5J4X5A7_9EUKA|nr:MAG: hypothetical protein EZS28_002293 [Streblomastix strix]
MEFEEAPELMSTTTSQFVKILKSGDDDQRIKSIQSLLRYAAGGYENFEKLVKQNVFDEISNVARSCGHGPLFLICDTAKWMYQCTRKVSESKADEIYHLRHELEELKSKLKLD